MTGRWRGAAVLLAVLAVAAGVWLLRPGSGPSDPGQPEPEAAPAGAEFSEARIVGRRRGERQWVVDTRRLREEAEDQVRAERIESGTLYRDSRPYIDLQALEAVANRVTNDLTLTGDVIAVHVDGAVLRTETLEWVAEEERLIAPGPVEIQRGDERVAARRMEVEWAVDMVSMFGDVIMERETGHWLRAERVDYQLDGDDVWVRGSFRAAIPSRRAEEQGEERSP